MIHADQNHHTAGASVQNTSITKQYISGLSKNLQETFRKFEHKAGSHQYEKTDGKDDVLHFFRSVEPHKVTFAGDRFGRYGSFITKRQFIICHD